MLAETPERIDWSAGDVKEGVGNFSLRPRKFARVRVLVMTAFATPEIVERARRFGVFAVITKPFEIGELAPLLRRAIHAAPFE